MTGAGICMTRSRDQITSVTRMPSNTCAVWDLRQSMNWSIWAYHSRAMKTDGFIKDHSVANQRISAKVGNKPQEPVRRPTEPDMRCCIRYIRAISRQVQCSFLNGLQLIWLKTQAGLLLVLSRSAWKRVKLITSKPGQRLLQPGVLVGFFNQPPMR